MKNSIKERRKEVGLSQADLARKLNVSRSWINRIENGKQTPNVKSSIRIAEVLGCTLNDIFLQQTLTNEVTGGELIETTK